MRLIRIGFIVLLLAVSAWGQHDGYLIYGNRDGSPIPAPLGDTIEIPVWGVAYDTIMFMHLPLASSDSIISTRLGGYFPDTMVGHFDDKSFLTPNAHDTVWANPPRGWPIAIVGDTFIAPGWTSQSMLAWNCHFGDWNWFWTGGDTALICTFKMRMAYDTMCIGDTVAPFREGHNPANGELLWGIMGGYLSVIPTTTYSRLLVLPSSRCHYIPGDANGDSSLNGLDATYSVAYFKGGHPPAYTCLCIYGNPWWVEGDVNATCTYNGLDIAYLVAYFKGGPAPQPCPACPPGQ